MANILSVKNLRKVYKKNQIAVDNVTFDVKKGEIFGLIGSNGAGKSTILRTISTLIKPTSGEVRVMNINVVRNPDEARKNIAYMPENLIPPAEIKAIDFVYSIAKLYSINTGKDPNEIVSKAIEISDTKKHANKKANELSNGTFRRLLLGLILALDAPLTLLDEPTAGIDTVESIKMRNIIKNSGKTVVFTSHNLREVEKLCDRVAILHEGRLLLLEQTTKLIEKYGDLEKAFIVTIKGEAK